jgi:hypothetical protein
MMHLRDLPRRAAVLAVLLGACVPAAARPTAGAGREAEEYAVWGAALDALAGGSRGVPVIVGARAAALRLNVHERREMEAYGGAVGVRPALAAALAAGDTAPAAVDPVALGRHTRVRVARTPGEVRRLEEEMRRARRIVAARVTLSRVVFDPEHTQAVVHATWACGAMCGHGELMVLERDTRGRWRRKTGLGMVVF